MATAVLERSLCPISCPELQATERILVIEDDPALRKVLQHLFSVEGYEVNLLPDAFVGLETFQRETASILIVDLGKAGSARYDLFRQFAKSHPGLSLLVISADSEIQEKVMFLELGADDYVTIPFSPRELLARVRAIARRTSPVRHESFYSFGGVMVDFLSMKVTRRGEAVELTNKEFKTLTYMIKNAGRVLAREEFLNEVWGYSSYPCTRTVDNHILKLRQKLENDPSSPSHFLTMHGVGYRFVP